MNDSEVAIYEAESRYLHCYRIFENQLTSRVFGMLAMLPQETVLLPFLEKLARGSTSGEVGTGPELAAMTRLGRHRTSYTAPARIRLWERIGDRYPDVCIDTEKVLIIIEVKKDTEPPPQEYVKELAGQYRGASEKAASKELAYFLLTRGCQRPPAIRQAQDRLKSIARDVRIYWRRWPQVWEWLRAIAESDEIDDVSKKLLHATIKLIEEENMTGSTGFRDGEEGWRKAREALMRIQDRYREIDRTMKEVSSQVTDEDLECLKGECGLAKKHLLTEMPSFVGYPFKDKEWRRVTDPGKHPALHTNFELNDLETLGVSVGLWWPVLDNKDRDEKARELEREVGERIDRSRRYRVENLEDGIWIDHSPEASELHEGEEAVNTLVTRLVQMRNLANELGTLHQALGVKSPRTSSKRTG